MSESGEKSIGQNRVSRGAVSKEPEIWESFGPIERANFNTVKAIRDLSDRGIDIPEDVLDRVVNRMESLITMAEGSRVFAKEVFIDHIKRVDWGGLYEEIALLGANLNSDAVRKNPDFEGVVPYVYDGAYAQLVSLGIQAKESSGVPDDEWRIRHGYDQDTIDKLKEEGTEKHGDILVKPGIEKLVNEYDKKKKEELKGYGVEEPGEKEAFQKAQMEAMLGRNDVEREYYEGMRQDYEGFVSTMVYRVGFDPKMFDLNPPYWYTKLTDDEKGMIRTLINTTNLASHTEVYGMTDFNQVMGVMGIRMDKEYVDHMFKEMPGFSTVMATMIDHIFERNKDHFVISDQGYEILDNFDSYKTALVEALEKHLNGKGKNQMKFFKDFYIKGTNPERPQADEDPRKRSRVAAKAAVAAVDNLFYATGVYTSADENRKVFNTKVWAEQPRAFFMPGVKGISKWTSAKTDKLSEAGEKEFKNFRKDAEDWGGPTGAYIRERVAHDSAFAEKFISGKLRYLPKRLFFSLFDHTYFTKQQTENYTAGGFQLDPNRNEISLSEVLIQSDRLNLGTIFKPTFEIEDKTSSKDIKPKIKVQRTFNLLDFEHKNEGDSEYIDISKLGKDELYGAYADLRSHAIPMYLHYTNKDPKARESVSGYIDDLNKLRDDSRLSQLVALDKDGKEIKNEDGVPVRVFWDEDLITMGIALAASPDGVITGTSELVLKLPDTIYDNKVLEAISDDRLYVDMPRDFRKKLLAKLNAVDVTGIASSLFADLTGGTPISKRTRLRNSATTVLERYAKNPKQPPAKK